MQVIAHSHFQAQPISANHSSYEKAKGVHFHEDQRNGRLPGRLKAMSDEG